LAKVGSNEQAFGFRRRMGKVDSLSEGEIPVKGKEKIKKRLGSLFQSLLYDNRVPSQSNSPPCPP
jgi:hypothetical protein